MVDELTILKSFHVLAAVFWVGGAFVLNVAMALAAHQAEPTARVMAFKLAGFLTYKIFVPLAAVVLASGIWLTAEYFDFGYLWVTLGLIGLITAVIVGVGYLAPRARDAVAAIESGAGPPPPGTRNWVPIVGRLNLLLLTAVVVIMVIKPT